MSGGVERFESGAARVYRIELDLFPGLVGFAHLVAAPDLLALIDVGSGFGDSNEQLEAGLRSIAGRFREACEWGDLTHVVISHGHIDHFGGLEFVRRQTSAPVGIHRLDRPVLTRFEASLEAMAGRLRRYLASAGVGEAERDDLMDLYLLTKSLFRSQPVDFALDPQAGLGPLRLLHTPGHCPGQVVIRLGDLLLTSDHVLPEISPHMAPASLARHTGLQVYLASLDGFTRWAQGARLALGGHGPPMPDVLGRAGEIRRHHELRLARLLDLLDEPGSVAELADRMFPQAGGYHRLLALQEVGAHVEYLQHQGRLHRGRGVGGVRRYARVSQDGRRQPARVRGGRVGP